ncbi:MAG: hypothetical protein RLZZ495_815 [Pseudomonadota bacterium]
MTVTFTEKFDQLGAWRREFALRLKLLSEWLRDNDLIDSGLEERLVRLGEQVRSDKVMVAFVAEFSRGKSELINAIFFAGYGRRIMPATAGRTTMCPTEMGYDAEIPPCLRLLPIETRLKPQALMEWRMAPEKWERFDLDVNNSQQLASVMEKVAEVRMVTKDRARALGLWHDDSPDDNPPVDADGMVEVPKWRHALINIAHPLLKQGLVILDTPGLNAIGAEPELTVSLIPQAHAVVFILGADTGVTKSDLAIWREHLMPDTDSQDSRLVVLNKIDGLWDALSTPTQIDLQIMRQQTSTADILSIPHEHVIAVSAQKGLVAKVTNDAELLTRSRLPMLEEALGLGMMKKRQKILGNAMIAGITDLRTEAARIINVRKRDLTEQLMELNGLHGKNASMVRHMRSRIAQEQTEFNLGGAKIHAVRSVHMRLMREVLDLLSTTMLKQELTQLSQRLQSKGIKIGIRQAYDDTFGRLRGNLQKAQLLCNEIQSMLGASFKQLNVEHGFSLQVPPTPLMDRHTSDLDTVERNHLQYLSLTNALKLAQPEFADRLMRALATRLRTIHDTALADVELWSKTAGAQIDVQLRERHRHFRHRLEAIDRIQQATGGLEERVKDIDQQETALCQVELKLIELTDHLLAANRAITEDTPHPPPPSAASATAEADTIAPETVG